jgi:transposase
MTSSFDGFPSPARWLCTDRGAGWQSGNGDDEGGLDNKIHLAVDAYGMPVEVLVTEGPVADCTKAPEQNIEAQYLLADRGYDTNAIVGKAQEAGMKVVIPPKRNRKVQRAYDKALYRYRPGGECVSAFEALAGHCDPLCQKCGFFCGCRAIRCVALWVKGAPGRSNAGRRAAGKI